MAPIIPTTIHLSRSVLNGFPPPPLLPLLAVGLNIPDKYWFTGLSLDDDDGGGGGDGREFDDFWCWLSEDSVFLPTGSLDFEGVFPS